jgi:hypothetical protein
MTDNAQNNRYIVPYIKSLSSQIYEIPSVVVLEQTSGSPVIEKNCVTLNGNTGDAVQSTQKYNIDPNHGFVFQCNLPTLSNSYELIGLYVGCDNYGIYLVNNTIILWTFQEPSIGLYNYKHNDFFQMIFDGFYVNFILNGRILQKAYIDSDPDPAQVWIGFDGYIGINTNITVTQIHAYQTGVRGEDGIKGADCNSILSTYKDITNVVTNLQNYGITGDYYHDKLTNNIYGPKLGLCGSLYFDSTAYNPTGPVIPTLLRVPTSNNIKMGSGDFTVEWFQYARPSSGNNSRIFSIGSFTDTDPGTHGSPPVANNPNKGASLAVSIEGSGPDQQLIVWINSSRAHNQSVSGAHNMGTVNVYNRWAHIALVRSNTGSGGLYKVYIDGVALSTTFTGTDSLIDTNPLTIGGEAVPQSNTFFSGHITNFKWTKGNANYTNNFAVSLVPLNTTHTPQILLTSNTYVAKFQDSSASNTVVSDVGTVPVSWNVANPFFGFASNAWSGTNQQVLYDPSPFVTSLGVNSTTTVWNFNNGNIAYNSLLFYISFATSTDVLDIPNVVILVANYNSSNNTVAYKKLDGVNLPDNITLVINNSLLQLTSSVLAQEFPYISVKVIALDNNTYRA